MPGRKFSAGSEYRYGFNGKEKSDEVYGEGNGYDFGARMFDPRVGRWFSVDKDVKPAFSSYQFTKGNPINYIDPDGNDEIHFYYFTRDYLDANGKAFTTITISTVIIENGQITHTFFVHNQNIGTLDGEGTQIKPFKDGSNLPNQSSFCAAENGLPFAEVTDFLYGLGKNYTDDYEYLGKLLQVDPTVSEHYKGNNLWAWAFNGAKSQASTAKFAKKLLGISETTFALIDGYYALKGLAGPWMAISSGGYRTAGFSINVLKNSSKFTYQFGKCVEYANAFVKDVNAIVKSAGGNAKIFEINIGSNNTIGTANQMLSNNGMHRYVEVTIGNEVRIYDNFHPNGVSKADYAKSIEGMINTSKGRTLISGEQLLKNAKQVN